MAQHALELALFYVNQTKKQKVDALCFSC
jgi:hypothetical protein